MKIVYLGVIFGIGLLGLFLVASQNTYAYTCAVNAPSVPLKYYYLHADSVFVGAVSSITNDTNHQYIVKFDLEKSWKGSQHPVITTYSLVACGYSFVKGEQYLVFASGDPPNYFEWATKPLDVAQDDIAQIDSQQFQTQANTDEQLYKKLVNAKDAISNMMGSKMLEFPISSVSVDDLNFTLDVGIADKQASTQLGAQEYKIKIGSIVEGVPIAIRYEEYATPADNLTSQKPQCCGPEPLVIVKVVDSPLKQFKSGIKAEDVKCILGFELVIKTENNSPACVELETAQKFVDRGWATQIIPNVLNSGTIVTIPANSSISSSGLTFSPSTIQVVIGVNNTVEWINMDGPMNDITSDTGSFETSLISHGHAWEYLFDKTGTYQYHSAIHPWLKGTVIVVENNTSTQQISNSDLQTKSLSENNDSWYIGKSATQNMYVKYKIEDNGTNNGNPYEMTIYFKEHDPDNQYWNATVSVAYNDKIVTGTFHLADDNLRILSDSNVSDAMKPYEDSYSRTLDSLAIVATEPGKPLSAPWWCAQLTIHSCFFKVSPSVETVNVPAGTFSCKVLTDRRYETYVNQDMPYPVKRIISTVDTTASSPTPYSEYELLEMGHF